MKAILAAAVRNPVFANLLMILLVVGGLITVRTLRREMFPEFSFDRVQVTAVYPGATPEDIERSVTIKIEEAVRGLDGVRKVESTSSEGLASVSAEIDADERAPEDALVDIRNEVSRITTFPDDVDEPNVQLIVNRPVVMTLVLWGEASEETLTSVAKEIEEELLLLPEVKSVGVAGLRPYEVNVTVREADLQRFHLSFDDVGRAISAGSLDLPVGKMRGPSEEQLLRVNQERRWGRELGTIPVVTRPDGTRILLRDVASVDDGFTEDVEAAAVIPTGEERSHRAAVITVSRGSEEDTIVVARAVEDYIETKAPGLPEGLELEIWRDDSIAVVERLSLLTENGLQGLLLVFAILLLFLGTRLSFWVAAGLPVAFLATMIFLEAFGGSLNMISSFGLIMVLGILVDDSIVVAENMARHMREKGYTVDAAIEGLQEVTWPVIASVSTTIIAFLPLFFIPGIMGKFIKIMPVAVVAALLASLVECLVILPAHLAHARPPRDRKRGFARMRAWIDARTDAFAESVYGPSIDWSVSNRYVVMALSLAFLIVVAGAVASGRPAFVFFPRLDAERVKADVTMPQGTPLAETRRVLDRLEQAARDLRDEFPPASDGGSVVRRILVRAGESGSHTGQVEVELARSSQRSTRGITIFNRWRELAGEFPQARSVTIGGTTHGPGGPPIELRVMAPSHTEGVEVAEELHVALASYPGVFNVEDNLEPGKRELRFDLQPAADSLGLTVDALARQLQAGFAGREVRKIQRGRDEVEVRVRYDADLRRTRDQLAGLRLRAPDDSVIPLEWAAEIERARGLSRIERRDGRRVVRITADVDTAVTNANAVVGSLREEHLPRLEAAHPSTRFVFGGQQEEQAETLAGLLAGFVIAMIGIYAILALLFGSYVQPIVVMMAIPVGFGGAILGHAIVGSPLMLFSLFGMVGLTGIVVNDALVMIDFINRHRREGHSALLAATRSGRVRFRAVFLTTVTTVAGLLPIMLETSLQAQFVIPMALSIASGVAMATLLTLYVVPCAYLMIEDVRGLFVRNA